MKYEQKKSGYLKNSYCSAIHVGLPSAFIMIPHDDFIITQKINFIYFYFYLRII